MQTFSRLLNAVESKQRFWRSRTFMVFVLDGPNEFANETGSKNVIALWLKCIYVAVFCLEKTHHLTQVHSV